MKVVIRKFPMSGNLAALFPEVRVNQWNPQLRLSLDSALQRGSITLNVFMRITVPASDEECVAFKQRIESALNTTVEVVQL